jgi:hypothetical protein
MMSKKAAVRLLGVLAAAIVGIAIGFMFAARDYRVSLAPASHADQPLEASLPLAPSDNAPDISASGDDPQLGPSARRVKSSK